MKFKNANQRKAVMAKLKSFRLLGSPRNSPTIIKATSRTDAYKKYGRTYGSQGVSDWIKVKDTDGDGVPDHKDCAPHDPKRQGVLHDWNMKRLKAQEEKLESKRQKLQNKLEDRREELTLKSKIQQSKMEQKQAIIDQVEGEKKAIRDMKEANRRMNEELEKGTLKGKAKDIAKAGAKNFRENTRRWATDPRNRYSGDKR